MQAIFSARVKLDVDNIRGGLCFGALIVGVIANTAWVGWLTWEAGRAAWAVAELLR